jgi:hypothetical protein
VRVYLVLWYFDHGCRRNGSQLTLILDIVPRTCAALVQ